MFDAHSFHGGVARAHFKLKEFFWFVEVYFVCGQHDLNVNFESHRTDSSFEPATTQTQ